jgi:hypothetical protein
VSRTGRRPAVAFVSLLAVLTVLGVACSGSSADAAFGHYLQADSRPNDPSSRVEFGRGSLPKDIPSGLPVPKGASLLGWARTTTDSSYSWDAAYEAPGDTSRVAASMADGLAKGGWQVQDRAERNGFIALNFAGQGKNDGRTGVLSVGPAVRSGRVQVIVEVGQDRQP